MRLWQQPIAMSLAVVLLATLAIAPWGDYPINDDWQYARAAKHLADTHEMRVDTPVAPSLVGQCYLVAPFIRLFGFSHRLLRVLTLLLSLLCLWCVDRLLFYAEASLGVRRLVQLALVLNPIYLYLSLSFMTEIYGYLPTLLAAVLWFGERKRRPEAPMVRWHIAAAAGLLVGASFWTRQFCVTLFPALLLATLPWRSLRGLWRAAPAALLGTGLFAAVVLAYFPWAEATGNFSVAFNTPLSRLTTLKLDTWLGDSGALAFYLTAFLAPLLVLLSWQGLGAWRRLGVASAAALLGGWTVLHFRTVAHQDFSNTAFRNRVFPFLSNLIRNAGVGPVTVTDTYLYGLPHVAWSPAVWRWVELAILAMLVVVWVPLVARARFRKRELTLGGELIRFACWWAGLTGVLMFQAYQERIFDRYMLPMLLALALVIGVLARPRRRQLVAFGLLLLPVAGFGVAGLHDYFRWNDARWGFVQKLQRMGVSPTTVNGGYEVNGWLVADNIHAHRPPQGCIGACGCAVQRGELYCQDDSWQIGFYQRPGYLVFDHAPIRYWLAKGPGMLLLKRQRSP